MAPSDSEKTIMELDNEESCTNRKTHYYEFKEHEQVKKLLTNLHENIKDSRNRAQSYEQFRFICDNYKEQPHLIDPFLSDIIAKLINTVKETIQTQQPSNILVDEAFKYIYCLAKMRSYKRIVQYLPHKITDFEPVLKFLENQNLKDLGSWQTRFILLLWLSIICTVPFDLEHLDNSENQNDSFLNRFLKACMVIIILNEFNV